MAMATRQVSRRLYGFWRMVREEPYIVLDTETTGLHEPEVEVCDIAIVDSGGNVLFDSLVKPVRGIPEAASAVHGIRDDTVSDAPGWGDVWPVVEGIMRGRNVVIYNAEFDLMAVHNAGLQAEVTVGLVGLATYYCAMKAFAEVYRSWDYRRREYRWQKLGRAAAYYDIEQPAAHRALADTLVTLEVCRAIGEREDFYLKGQRA